MSEAIPPRETLVIEFKSDRRGLSDDEMVEAVIADQASRLLGRLTDEEVLAAEGERRWRVYRPGPKMKDQTS